MHGTHRQKYDSLNTVSDLVKLSNAVPNLDYVPFVAREGCE